VLFNASWQARDVARSSFQSIALRMAVPQLFPGSLSAAIVFA
jgi:hypothetical protein